MATYSGYEDYGYGYEQSASANSGGYGYESYESYDSRPSLKYRDLYRSGYDLSEAPHDTDNAYEGRYDSSYGNRRGQFQTRARSNFPQLGQTWGRDWRKTRPLASFPGRLSGPWNEPQQPMGRWGSGASGSPRPPPLFAQKPYPDLSLFQGMRGFSGNRRFGGGGLKQRRGKNIKVWDGDKSQQQTAQQKKKLKESVATKKRKQTNTTDEPESKVAKNEDGDEAAAEEKSADDAEAAAAADGEAGADKGSLTIDEEISEVKQKLQAGKKTQDRQKKRQRDRMVERIQYVCSLCKFRTYYDEEMSSHLESKFHSDHFSFVGTKLPKQTAEFLQEYVSNKHKKTVERRKSVEDINAAIQQIYKDQDLTLDLGMDHFVKKVEAAHCAACDLFIPMQFGFIQKHLKSIEHNQNRKAMMDQSKKTALIVAKSILNNKMISKKLEIYMKGENPFVDEPKEKSEEAGGKESAEDGTAEGTEESRCEEGTETEGTSEARTGKESVNDQSALTADEEERQLEGGDEEGGDEEGGDEEGGDEEGGDEEGGDEVGGDEDGAEAEQEEPEEEEEEEEEGGEEAEPME